MKMKFTVLNKKFNFDGGPYSIWMDEQVEKWSGARNSDQYERMLEFLHPYVIQQTPVQQIKLDGLTVNVFATAESDCAIGFGDDAFLIFEAYKLDPQGAPDVSICANEIRAISVDDRNAVELLQRHYDHPVRVYVFPAACGYENVEKDCVMLPLSEALHENDLRRHSDLGFKFQISPGTWTLDAVADSNGQYFYRGAILRKRSRFE